MNTYEHWAVIMSYPEVIRQEQTLFWSIWHARTDDVKVPAVRATTQEQTRQVCVPCLGRVGHPLTGRNSRGSPNASAYKDCPMSRLRTVMRHDETLATAVPCADGFHFALRHFPALKRPWSARAQGAQWKYRLSGPAFHQGDGDLHTHCKILPIAHHH